MKLVFHVFITQKRFEIQNRQILQFALYSFIHNFWSTIPIRIINLSSSGKLHCCCLTPLSFPLIPFYFNRFLTAAEILTNLLMSAGVIWPFQKIEESTVFPGLWYFAFLRWPFRDIWGKLSCSGYLFCMHINLIQWIIAYLKRHGTVVLYRYSGTVATRFLYPEIVSRGN